MKHGPTFCRPSRSAAIPHFGFVRFETAPRSCFTRYIEWRLNSLTNIEIAKQNFLGPSSARQTYFIRVFSSVLIILSACVSYGLTIEVGMNEGFIYCSNPPLLARACSLLSLILVAWLPVDNLKSTKRMCLELILLMLIPIAVNSLSVLVLNNCFCICGYFTPLGHP
jgi:hypothetical protein